MEDASRLSLCIEDQTVGQLGADRARRECKGPYPTKKDPFPPAANLQNADTSTLATVLFQEKQAKALLNVSHVYSKSESTHHTGVVDGLV